MNWREQAVILYRAGKKITYIAEKVGRSRKTVSRYINELSNVEDINRQREATAKEYRKEYKRKWKSKGNGIVDAALMKRQHDIDAMVLSKEQYLNE